ncbi:ubiquitin carboxyl-terminal hydrolase 8-like isoform X2 [Lineus longissimus]|uniref:ubiquitin carboxyl-terminal hydrolase 8-like isoform X2 n=1 Tax=Lineus longissimus TaxID=88925 RepID=UPI002B4DD549
MPSEVVPLYLGHAMADLNKLADITHKVTNAKVFIKSADKVYSTAVDAQKKGDEEKAYVMFMKYFNIITLVKKSPDFRKNAEFFNKLISTSNSLKAIEAAEKLSTSLKDRYDLLKAEEVSSKLDKLEIEKNDRAKKTLETKKLEEEQTEIEKETVEEKEVDDIPPGAITVPQTYKYLMNNEMNIILMDVRPAKEFENSHINRKNCISVPVEIIPPGRTVTYIEPELPAASKELWAKRGVMDYIILLDWNSNIDHLMPGTSLRTLKDAIFKFDSSTVIRSEPLVLEGGYENWLLHYPTVTTNANVPLTPSVNKTLTTNLLDFDYPDFEETFMPPTPKPDPPQAKQNNTDIAVNNVAQIDVNTPEANKIPTVNRALKPKVGQGQSQMDALENNSSAYIHNKVDNGFFIDNLGTKNTNEPAPSNVDIAKSLPKSQTMDNIDLDKFISQARSPPKVDRAVKPKLDRTEKPTKPTLSQEAEVLAQDLKDLHRIKVERETELEHYKKEQERVILEHKARLAKLKDEEKKMEELEQMRHKEEKMVADLMREKRRIQEEISATKEKYLEEERSKVEEEKRKREEIARMEEREKQKLRLQEEVTRMRTEKKMKEEEKKVTPPPPEEVKPSVVDSPNEPLPESPKAEKQPTPQPSPQKPEMPEVSTSPTADKSLLEDNIPGSDASIHTAKLRDEPQERKLSGSGSGMRRSTSTPNIASLADDAEAMPRQEPKPAVSRVVKPRESPKPSMTNTFLSLDADKIMSLNPDYGKSEPGLTGLRNQGNTCYMNSIIQCLSNTVPLISYFLSNNYRLDINRENFMGCKGEVADEAALVMNALWSTHYRSVTPRDLKHTISRHQPMFAGYIQHDSQEFLCYILDALHEDLNMIKTRPKVPVQETDGVPDHIAAEVAWKTYKLLNESIIVELFQGQLKSTLMCLKCRKTSVKFETVMHLSLPLPSSSRCTMHDCLNLYLKEEKLSGSSKWFCPQCKTRREASKKTEIWKLPAILLIHLKRFSSDGSWHQKLNTAVDFPLHSLDLKRYVRGHRVRPDYRLYAISNHYGTMEGGHYTAYAYNYLRRSWLKFDDADVSSISERNIKTSAAYTLFYTSIPDPDRRMHGNV